MPILILASQKKCTYGGLIWTDNFIYTEYIHTFYCSDVSNVVIKLVTKNII